MAGSAALLCLAAGVGPSVHLPIATMTSRTGQSIRSRHYPLSSPLPPRDPCPLENRPKNGLLTLAPPTVLLHSRVAESAENPWKSRAVGSKNCYTKLLHKLPSGMCLRDGQFYLRRRVPRDVREHTGKRTPSNRSGAGLTPSTGWPSRYLATFAIGPSCPAANKRLEWRSDPIRSKTALKSICTAISIKYVCIWCVSFLLWSCRGSNVARTSLPPKYRTSGLVERTRSWRMSK